MSHVTKALISEVIYAWSALIREKTKAIVCEECLNCYCYKIKKTKTASLWSNAYNRRVSREFTLFLSYNNMLIQRMNTILNHGVGNFHIKKINVTYYTLFWNCFLDNNIVIKRLM